jgi:hypothetical protein
MSLPAIAALMRASSYPNVANAGARFFEGLTALLASGANDALDTELKAVLDESGAQVFPNGTATTEAAAQEIFEERPQFLEEFGTIVTRYLSDGAAGGSGTSELRVRLTAKDLRDAGATTSLTVALGNQLAKARATRAYVLNLGIALTGLVSLVAKVGHIGNDDSLLVDATVFAANAANETAPVTPVTSYIADTILEAIFTAGANFDLLDAGILDDTEVLEIVVEMTN